MWAAPGGAARFERAGISPEAWLPHSPLFGAETRSSWLRKTAHSPSPEHLTHPDLFRSLRRMLLRPPASVFCNSAPSRQSPHDAACSACSRAACSNAATMHASCIKANGGIDIAAHPPCTLRSRSRSPFTGPPPAPCLSSCLCGFCVASVLLRCRTHIGIGMPSRPPLRHDTLPSYACLPSTPTTLTIPRAICIVPFAVFRPLQHALPGCRLAEAGGTEALGKRGRREDDGAEIWRLESSALDGGDRSVVKTLKQA